jgi:tetratricopeptide (TPR) repeat protein
MTVPAALAVALLVGLLIAGVGYVVRGQRRRSDRPPPYLVALGALADGDEPTAFEELKNAVRENSGNVDAYLRLGDLFRRRNDPERALHIHRELAVRKGLPRATESRIQESLCRDHLALGRLDRAEEAAKEVARLTVDSTAGPELLLAVHLKRNDKEAAFRDKREILKREGRAKTGVFELADFRADQAADLLEEGKLKEAERILKEARKIESGSRRARLHGGRLLELEGDYSGAIEAWETMLREGDEGAETLFQNLERVRFLEGSFSDMEGTYRRFLERTPTSTPATFGLARFLRRKGHLDEALEICRSGLHADAESDTLRPLLLALLLQTNRVAEAEAVLNEWMADGHHPPRHATEGGSGSMSEITA